MRRLLRREPRRQLFNVLGCWRTSRRRFSRLRFIDGTQLEKAFHAIASSRSIKRMKTHSAALDSVCQCAVNEWRSGKHLLSASAGPANRGGSSGVTAATAGT